MGSAVESAVSLAHRLQFCLEDVEVKTVFCMGPLTTTRACQSRVAIHTTTLAHQLGCLLNGNAQCQSGTPAWLHGRQLHTKQSCDNQRCTLQPHRHPRACRTRRCRLGIWRSHECRGLQAIPNTVARTPVEQKHMRTFSNTSQTGSRHGPGHPHHRTTASAHQRLQALQKHMPGVVHEHHLEEPPR